MGDGLMRQHFGHLLGLPAAVPPLPRSPLVPAAAELFDEQRRTGLRHAADALFPGAATTAVRFRILDGLQIPGRGRHWRPVTRTALAEARDAWLAAPGADPRTVASLFARYDRVLAADPMGLRRLALYELVGLLQQHPHGPVATAARELGVDPAEAEGLAYAVRLEPLRTAPLRESAERIVDAWRAGRLRRTQEYATRLGDPGDDQRLDRFLRRVRRRSDQVRELLAEGVRLECAGDPAGAAAVLLDAARTAVDEPRAVEGLLRNAAAAPAAGRTVAARVLPDGVHLDWSGPAGPYRVLRGRRGQWTELVGATDLTALADADAPLGERVRYAVLPLDDPAADADTDAPADGPDVRRIRELPAVSAFVLVAPDVQDAELTDARARVTARWRTPPGAHGVLVERLGGGRPISVPADRDGFAEDRLPPGEHRYTIRCRYRTAGGEETASPGVDVRATVHPWPEPVTRLDIAPGERPGSLAVAWSGGEGAELRLVDLPGPLPAQGADVALGDLPAEVAWERTPVYTPAGPGLELRPPLGARARLTAVSVVGGRACVGPSVSVELPAAVTNLAVRREAPQSACVTFDWPGDVDCVLVSWEQSGERGSKTVTKSAYRTRGGLEVAVTAAGASFRADPVTLVDADFVVPAQAGGPAELPPYLAVSYDLVKPRWRPGRRRRVIVRTDDAAAAAAADEGAPELPEFVLVARAAVLGDRDTPPRPRHPADGATVLRLSGDELGQGAAVQRDIDMDVAVAGESPPYTLRAFLLGPRADSARLEEPPHERLVVR
ncbi:hypothetical protein AB0M39_24915 [Streptomyces sp. NPDC051907]|uniref:hypothetical protein n=1 Tax=Streptomyces sp. NPDC051907 TaxID=3155284 RepID=UPI00341DF01B